MSNHSQFTKGEFSSALWYCAFWKSGGFKKCGMKLDFLKKLSVSLALIKVVVWVVNYQKGKQQNVYIYKGVYFILCINFLIIIIIIIIIIHVNNKWLS